MGRTACTEHQCLYRGALYLYLTCKFEKHKQSFLSETHEQTFPNKKHKQSNALDKHTQSFPIENYNRTRRANALATSADSIPRLL
jgi:hypothetical protein